MNAYETYQPKRKATSEQSDFVRFLRSDTPESRAFTAQATFGIDIATYRCPGCGLPFEYPFSHCQGCRRPHQRRCATSGCGNILPQPIEQGESIPPYCAPCVSSTGRQARAQSFARSGIGPRERMTAQTWQGPMPDQAGAVDAIESWLASALWRAGEHYLGKCAVHLSGRPGRGKSVLAAYTVRRAFVDLALVPAFHWHTQATLAQVFAERHSRDTESSRGRSDQATNAWRAVTESPMLVLDDLFAERLTPAFGEALATLVRERLDQCRPTLITSNYLPTWQVFFEHDVGRLQSRWDGYGISIPIAGVDLRTGRQA